MDVTRAIPALALGFAVAVILAAPEIVGDPNVLAVPSAGVVAIGCIAAFFGGRWTRRTATTISALGLVLTTLWLWLALDGFGKGTPWWDDVIEAAILFVAFLVALLGLFAGRRLLQDSHDLLTDR
jgi:hypothetical protein